MIVMGDDRSDKVVQVFAIKDTSCTQRTRGLILRRRVVSVMSLASGE